MGAPLFLPRRDAAFQPQVSWAINRANPITRDLSFAWCASAPDVNLVNGRQAVAAPSPQAAKSPYVGRTGRKFVSGSAAIDFGNNKDTDFAGINNQTVFAEIFIPDTTACSGYIFGRVVGSWDYDFNIDSGSQTINFGTGGNPTGPSVPANSVGNGLLFLQGRPVSLCGTYDKVTARAYADGIQYGTQAMSSNFPSDSDSFAIGARGGSGQSGASGYSTGLVLIFKRTLSASEVKSLSDNPWQVFVTPQRALYLVAAGGAAALAGTAAAIATGNGALSTSISLAGTAAAAASASGALTTSVALAGAASAQTTATGAVTTGIALSGAASCVATAAGAITTAISLNGAAAATAGATGGLTTAIALNGAASCTAAGTGALTTAIALTGAATAAATATGALTAPGAGLAGSATCSATASGALSTSIALAGTAAVTAAATGALTAPGSGLSGSATCGAIASGVLTTAIAMSGTASVTASATGALAGSAAALSGSATCAAAATGSLTTGIALVSASGAAVFASGALTTAIRLSGSASCISIATGALSAMSPETEPTYTRAPPGIGYTPRHVAWQGRPAVVANATRPAATQGRER